MKEYDNGIKHEKSGLKNFAEKYVIDGKPKIMPFDYFAEKATQIKEFLRNHRNIKIRMIMVCLLEQVYIGKRKNYINQEKIYFNSETYINLESTDVKALLSKMLKKILNEIGYYQVNGSGWYFKEVLSLEIHTVKYKPIKGSSYIPLPDFVMRKKSIINIQNKDNKCFLWSILRYLHPIQKHETRLTDIRKYENDFNFKGIDMEGMEPYIRKNTDLTKIATNSFEKDFFKLMNNSVFGKMIENIRKRQNFILIDNKKMAYKLSSKPNFDRSTIFDENLIACHMKKTEVYFNKPIYFGQAILDLSKTLMFDFHYNYIREKFKNKAELLFTDTGSLMYLIQTEDFYQDINKDIRRKFDTSDYPEKHPSAIKTGINEKVIGKFKDEAAVKQITDFVGLRPKLYSFKVEDEKETLKAKGVKKNVSKKTLSFEDYKECLFSEKEVIRDMNIIRSKNHDIYSMTMNKVALSSNDDKRIICEDKINTKALR